MVNLLAPHHSLPVSKSYEMRTLAFMIIVFVLPLLFASCSSAKLIDQNATDETKALYRNLGKLAEDHILFGHQHATEYGHGWQGDENRSDVKSVTGSHPAVIGIDFLGLSGIGVSDEQIAYESAIIKKTIQDTYNRGGVVTVTWHFNNPVSNTAFYWNDSAVAAVSRIIPGGSHHEEYKKILERIAALVKSCKGNDGKLVPMIFRPFHEFDGYWFWWGADYSTVGEFKTLWKFTVAYLRDTLSVRQFIYGWSPDNKFTNKQDYLERYPGNDWVDLVGMDNYNDMGRYGIYQLDSAYHKIKIVSDFAKKNNKLAALTETGLEGIPNTTWWTEVLLKTLKRSKLKLSYVLVWRNDIHSPTHYYAPFPGQVSVPDFMKFYNDPYTLFENDLKDMYK